MSYDVLLAYADNDLRYLAFEKNQSLVGDAPARKSKLISYLTKEGGHEGVVLEQADLYKLIVRMDTYAHRQGAFSEKQEGDLIALRGTLTNIIEKQ
jgi:hypothetical protein